MPDPAESAACQALESEMCVLGAMLLSQRAAEEMLDCLEPRDFFRPAHQTLFDSLYVYVESGKPVDDFPLLLQHLTDREELSRIGGADYLHEIASFVPSAANCNHHAGIVRDKADRRRAVELARKIGRLAATDADTDELYEIMRQGTLRSSGKDALLYESFNGVFKPTSMDFWWHPYFPKGKCILFDADGGTGKTSCTLAIAACLSQGRTPITNELCEPVKTLYLHKGEDQSDELETIYRANGGVHGAICYLMHTKDDMRLNARGLRRLKTAIIEGAFQLVVLDAFFYFLDGLVKDTSDNMAAMRVMEGLNRVAEETGCTIISIRHTVKDQVGKAASMLGMGTVQYRNSHRGQLLARWHPEERGLVVVVDEKGSLLVPRGDPFAFRREGLAIQFVNDFNNPFGPASSASKLTQAIGMITEMCDRKFVPVNEVIAKLTANKISEATIKRAREAMTNAKVLDCTRNGSSTGPWYLYVKKEGETDPFED